MRFLTKEEGASFDRLGPEYDKNYRWWGCSDRSVVNAVEKKKKKRKKRCMESRVAVFKGQRKERSSEGTMEPILFPHDIRHSVWLFTPVLIDPGSRSRQISGTFSTGKMSFSSKKKNRQISSKIPPPFFQE